MTFINTTPPEIANDSVAAMYRRQQNAWGYVPNYAKIFCHRPEVLARWGQLLAEIKRPMDKRLFELVTFAVACELGNSACALAHGTALREYFSDMQIAALAKARYEGILGANDRMVLSFARLVAVDAAKVSATDIARLHELEWSDADIFDVAAAAAGRAFFTKLLDALGVKADAAFRATLDKPLLQALTIGRPIDEDPVAQMPSGPSSVQPEGARHDH